MKFFVAAALASVAIAAPVSKDEGAEPTRTVSHYKPTGTGHYRPHGTGIVHGTGRPHHHKPYGTGVPHHHKPHGTGVPHHHRPHGTGVSHSGHIRPTEFHGPFEKPTSGFAVPTDMPILPRDTADAEDDLINDTTETGGGVEKVHTHKSGAAKPTGHHRHHKSGHAHATGHLHRTGEHGHAKPTGHHTGTKVHHPKVTAAAAATPVNDTPVQDDGETTAGDVEKRADDESHVIPTPVIGIPSGAAHPTDHHSHQPLGTGVHHSHKPHGTGEPHHGHGEPHGTGVHHSHKPHGTGKPHHGHGEPHGTGRPHHHEGEPHGTGRPHGTGEPRGPRPTGFRWGPGIEITPEMASSLFAEHGDEMPTGFLSNYFAAQTAAQTAVGAVAAQITPAPDAANF